MPEYDKRNYCKTKRVVGYLSHNVKEVVVQEAKEYNIPISDIICKAVNEYYENRPELVSSMKERIGKNRF
ncbi:MAG: hypothetical protein WAT92_20750 [Saprospiraceae bacterium]